MTMSYMLIGMAEQKALISERALVRRINRRLLAENHQMKRTRGFWDSNHLHHHEDTNLGRFYVVDLLHNFVVDYHIDLVRYARDLGAMAEWEELAPEA
jgi:hypothetical protein